MPFSGFPAEAFSFYAGLEADNSKAWFQANKTTYERSVRAPMEALLADLEGRFGTAKVFRPYRDVRFSKDKSPYKTSCAAIFEKGPYVSLDAGGLGVGAGMYQMATDQLARYRAAVAHDRTGEEVDRICDALDRAGIDTTAHDALATAPRGYPKDHPRIELLRQKGLIAWLQWPHEPWMHTAEPKKRITAFMKKVEPLLGWLDRNVGPSTLPPRM